MARRTLIFRIPEEASFSRGDDSGSLVDEVIRIARSKLPGVTYDSKRRLGKLVIVTVKIHEANPMDEVNFKLTLPNEASSCLDKS